MPPAIVEDWIRGQQKYGGWDAARLRSWLLLDDETSDLQDDDEMAAADFVEVPQLASRLSAAVGKDAHQKIDPVAVVESVPVNPKTGYYNALVLMVDGGGRYTRSAIGDYDILQTKGTQDFAATSLDAIFGGTGHRSMPIPIVHPFPLAENQLVAARSGVVGPLSVVTGPPGTGKSQVIAAIMLSAAAAGKSVLFAARQHRALDAVQERLHDVTGDRVLMVRANEADSWGGFNFLDALKGLQTRAGTQEGVPAFNRALARLKETDDKRWTLLARWQELHNITEAAASLSWRIEEVERKLLDSSQLLAAEQARPNSSCWRKCLDKFRAMLSLRPKVILIGQSWVRNQLERELAGLRQDLTVAEAKIASLRTPLEAAHENPASITDLVTELSKDLVLRLLDLLDNIAAKDRQALTEIIGDVALRGTHTLPSDAYRLILKHFPLWAVTTLAAGSRIPIVAGLFDYVIFDEAAQTDIASAIPLLFRAKTAVVVGDPMQLAMISNLDPKEERDLLQRYNLLRGGVGRFAQGRTNLFDLVSSCGTATRHILTDHYRCHPEIASYFNEAFYGRKLAALTDVNRLKIPRGYKAGLHWTDITGPIVARAGGTQSGSASSEAEAAAIIAQLKMLIDQNYAGTIGVVTFFDYQAKTIAGMADRAFGASALERHSVKVFTANKFQGDERDVMLLSLCLGASTPVGAKTFIQKERRLLNVAVSRARAICHIVGDLEYAAHSGIPHIEALVRKFRQAQNPRGASANDRFDSPWEKKLFDALVARGLSPTPQYPEGGRFLDLALINDRTAKKLDIEVDGVTFHTSADGYRLATDLWRDHQLKGLGWTILRFWVYELRDNMEKCLDRIEACYRS
jgi:very-short-patch-repair endonuclease